MNNKTIYKLVVAVIFMSLVYILIYARMINSDIEEIYASPGTYAFIEFGITTIILMIVPLIYYYNSNYNIEKAKSICKWNSIVIVLISAITWEWIGGIGWLIALIYYFINLVLFASNTDENNSNKAIIQKQNTITKETTTPKKTTDLKQNRRVEKTKTMDEKYSELKKLKDLYDKEIISKEEFDREKKKILK